MREKPILQLNSARTLLRKVDCDIIGSYVGGTRYCKIFEFNSYQSITFRNSESLVFRAVSVGIVSENSSNNIKAHLSVVEIASNSDKSKVLEQEAELMKAANAEPHSTNQYLKLKKPIQLEANTDYKVEVRIETENVNYNVIKGEPDKSLVHNLGNFFVVHNSGEFIQILHFYSRLGSLK